MISPALKGYVTACGKAHLSEGYGLQAVRKRFAIKPALQAAEKLCFVSGHDFSRAVND
jgi:hypothetical protein